MEYVFTALEGIASFISPCVLPLLPIYISYFAGEDSKKSRALINSIFFVIGFSTIFVVLAILANRVGNTFAQYRNYIKYIFGFFSIILGAGYIGFFEITIFNKFKKYNIDTKNLNIVKSFVFGILFSISMTPCVGTFLSSALLLVASQESLIKGIALILVYCLGMGIPFIISSVLIEKLKNIFKIIKENFKIIKSVSGMILIIMGIYIIFF